MRYGVLGRQTFSLQKSPTHPNLPQLLLRDATWYGQLWASSPSCIPPQVSVHPSPAHHQGKMRSRKVLGSVGGSSSQMLVTDNPPGRGHRAGRRGSEPCRGFPCSRGCAVRDMGWVLPTSCPRDGSSSSTPRSWGSVSTWVRVPETCVCWEHFPAVGAKHAHLRGVGFLPPGLRFGCPALLAARPAQAVRGHGGASPATALVLLTPNLTASPALKQKVLL